MHKHLVPPLWNRLIEGGRHVRHCKHNQSIKMAPYITRNRLLMYLRNVKSRVSHAIGWFGLIRLGGCPRFCSPQLSFSSTSRYPSGEPGLPCPNA
jgi:hypothetical protein